ncbi:MAG TPA: 30S ribosomal protein S13 [Planctomycetes bacterium]|nr:30S ribosomal protein S13 [Planctomycetota bacterium]
MARIAGIDIPNDKRLKIALRYIYGIGPHKALEICRSTDLDPEKKARELTEEEVTRIGAEIEKNHVVEGQLRRQIISNIQRLKDIRSYRGLRHIRGLPVRGQQTQANARTRKGPRKTVAGKKK